MSTRPFKRLRWSVFSFAAIAILLMTVLVACGSSNDKANPTNTSSSSSGAATTATKSTGATTSGTTTTMSGTPETTGSATGSMASPSMQQLGQIGTCIQDKTTPELVDDLRAGNTDSAKQVYSDCLKTQLPSTLVDQAQPIIDNAAECGVTASKELSDADVQRIQETQDPALIQQLTQNTLQCVSDSLGIQLP